MRYKCIYSNSHWYIGINSRNSRNSLLAILIRDVEVISGPKKKNKDCPSICRWDLNSISANDYSKLFLLNLHNSLHKFDYYQSLRNIS